MSPPRLDPAVIAWPMVYPASSTAKTRATEGTDCAGPDPAPCLVRRIAVVIPVSTLIHNTKSGRSGAAWQPGPEIGDGLTTDGEEPVALSAIDAGSVFATCVSPLVVRRNVTLTRDRKS